MWSGFSFLVVRPASYNFLVAAVRMKYMNTFVSRKKPVYWSTLGSGYKSRVVTALMLLELTKHLWYQPFLRTKSTNEVHLVCTASLNFLLIYSPSPFSRGSVLSVQWDPAPTVCGILLAPQSRLCACMLKSAVEALFKFPGRVLPCR